MDIDRRDVLVGMAALTTASSHPARGRASVNRVTQHELNEAIRLHGMWIADINSGKRCVFSGRDLSGLKFGVLGGETINLSGADFTQADLSGTEADDLLVHQSGFNGAKFDDCHWRQPVFAFADMRRASARRVILGTPGHRKPLEAPRADFSHAVLNDADLTDATISAYFYGTKLGGARLVRADLSHSDFLGPTHHQMSFAGANLTCAKLRDCRISSASFYHADCSGIDFSRAVFSDVRMKGCSLSGACFREAVIEQTIFSPEQRRDADFGMLA
jgi:uncharacterized protein YjbI with pentapeptide repeats